jgi:tetratricopeptide (TPR) repeat protein
MSLIIDALKRAQQLRLNGSEGSPILKDPFPNKKRKQSVKKQWVLVGAGLISLCILLLVFLRPPSLPSATQTNRAAVATEKKSSAAVLEKEDPTQELHDAGAALSGHAPSSVTEKTATEPPKEVASQPKAEEPMPVKHALNRDGTGQALNRNGAGLAPNSATSGNSTKQAMNRVGAGQVPPRAGTRQRGTQRPSKAVAALSNRSSPPPPPPLSAATQKEEAPAKSIGVVQEGGKDRALASEVVYHFNAGVTFYNQKDYSKAIQAYQKVIELNPFYVEAYNNLGIVYQMIGDVEKASKAYQKSTEINPKYEKGYNNLGILLLLKGRYEEASEAFQKALALNANNIESHIHLGVLFKKKGQWQEAIESYQKALAIDPFHGETHYNIALLYEQLENIELAMGHYQQFIQLASKSHPVLVSRVQRHLNDLMKTRNKQ